MFGQRNGTLKTETNNSGITVGLDIGTSKICALVAAPDEMPGSINILGLGIAESNGLNRGVVVNIEKTVRSIEKVITQAEQQAGIEITEVVVGIAGDHIQSQHAHGVVGISNPSHEITSFDVERLLEDSRRINVPSERKILHVIPQDFIIDGQDGVAEPIGMSGIRMEADVQVITGLRTAVQNIHRCVEKLGIRVKSLVLEPLASSYSVLSPEEKEVGVALVDIGAGTTDIAVFEENILRHTGVIALGGRQVTDDIRKVLGIIVAHAEKIKREFGHAYTSSMMYDEVFMIPGIGGRKPMEITRSYLSRIIQPRLEEIFTFALDEIRRTGYSSSLGAGVVITGGSALMKGVHELADEVFGMPVKIGVPSGISYLGLAPEIENPMYSTVVGLVLYDMNEKYKEQTHINAFSDMEDDAKYNKGKLFEIVKKFIEEL